MEKGKHKEVQEKKKVVQLKLNPRFYDVASVKEALKDFTSVCSGTILKPAITIRLIPKKDTPLLGEEFCNYVLCIMKNKGAF